MYFIMCALHSPARRRASAQARRARCGETRTVMVERERAAVRRVDAEVGELRRSSERHASSASTALLRDSHIAHATVHDEHRTGIKY